MLVLPLLCFPALAGTVRHGASVTFFVMVLLGAVLRWPQYDILNTFEKKTFKGYFLFFVCICFSVINTSDISESLKDIERLVRFLLVYCVYIYCKTLRVDFGRIFLVAIIIASFVFAFIAFLQHLSRFHPAHPVILAYSTIVTGQIAMIVFLITVLIFLFLTKQQWVKPILGLSILASFYVTLSSGSVGSWLAWLLLLIVGWQYIICQRFSFIKIFLWLFPLALALIIFIDKCPSQFSAPAINMINQLSKYKENTLLYGSLGSRFIMWKNSWLIWQQHPIIGAGLGDFSYETKKLVAEGKAIKFKKDFGHPHSIYFDYLSGTGLVGLGALLYFIFYRPFLFFYWHFSRSGYGTWRGFYAISGMVTLAAYAIFGLTESWLTRNPSITTFIVFVAVFQASCEREAENEDKTGVVAV